MYVYLDPTFSMMDGRNQGLFCSTINPEMVFDSLVKKGIYFSLQQNTHTELSLLWKTVLFMTLIARIAALLWGEIKYSETLAAGFGASP